MQNMAYYYDFSGQKSGYPLSLSINGFDRQVFSRQSSLELSYVLQGEYEVITEQLSCPLHSQELVVIAPGDLHMLRRLPESQGVILTVHIDFDRMPQLMTGQAAGAFSTMLCTRSENPALLRQARETLGQLLTLLIQPESSLFQMNARMMELLDIVSRHCAPPLETLAPKTPLHEHCAKALQYIHQHYAENIHLEDVARQLAFSVSYTSKIFKQHIGMPFVKYLAHVRVRASLESLLEGQENIQSVALSCGMPSAKAYTEAFKEMYGVPPNAYRKSFAKNLRYSEGTQQQSMGLDEKHKALLAPLLDCASAALYEDGRISICRKGDAIRCQLAPDVACEMRQAEGQLVLEFT